MKKFRIKVDLSSFFDDERKLVCILVDPNWESVLCLQRRVEQIFDVENLRFIMKDEGCFVPPQESIEVIKSGDVLKAFIPSTSMAKIKKKLKRKKDKASSGNALERSKEILEELDVENNEPVKKRKFKSLGLATASSTPNQAKRSKNVATISFDMLPIVAQEKAAFEMPTSTNETLGLLDKQKQVTAAQEISLIKSAKALHEKQSISSPVLKKRKHKKKTLQCEEHSTSHIEKVSKAKETNISSMAISTNLNDNQPNDNNISLMSSAKSHMHFKDNGEADTTTTLLTQNNTSELQTNCDKSLSHFLFRCQVAELPLSIPRMFASKKVENTKSPEIVNFTTDVMNKTNSTEMENPCTDINMNETSILADKPKSIIEIKEHIVISPKRCNTVEHEKCNNASDVIDEEHIVISPIKCKTVQLEKCDKASDEDSKTEEPVPMTENSAKDDNNDTTKNSENTEREEINADDSSVIALDSEEEDGQSDNKSDKSDTDEEMIVIKKKKCTDRSKLKSNSPDVSEIIDLNATDEDSEPSFSGRIASTQQYRDFIKGNKSINDILPFTTVLEQLPSVEDVIVFKMTRLDNKITDYIVGKCEYTNKRVQSIKLAVIGGLNEMNYISDRYKRSFNESSDTENRSLNVKMSDMIEPRIFQG